MEGAARRGARLARIASLLVLMRGLVACTNAYVRPTTSPVWQTSTPGTIAPGTLVTAQINQPLSTDHNRTGDRFTAELLDPLVDGSGQELVARGSQVDGIVRGTKRSAMAGQSADLDLQVTGLEQPGAALLPAPMEIAQSPVELTSATAREVLGGLGGAAVGAGVGVGVDRTQAGVVVGSTFIGLGLGVLAGYLFGMRDAVLPVGSVVTLRVTQPLVVDHPVASAWSVRARDACQSMPAPERPTPAPTAVVVPAGIKPASAPAVGP
jgi:hypothetical protein